MVDACECRLFRRFNAIFTRLFPQVERCIFNSARSADFTAGLGG